MEHPMDAQIEDAIATINAKDTAISYLMDREQVMTQKIAALEREVEELRDRPPVMDWKQVVVQSTFVTICTVGVFTVLQPWMMQ